MNFFLNVMQKRKHIILVYDLWYFNITEVIKHKKIFWL
jgi:hypothetical protein